MTLSTRASAKLPQHVRWRIPLGNIGMNVLFIGPALLIFTVFVVSPIVSSLGLSLTDWNGIAPTTHNVGLTNYQQLLKDADFWPALTHTLIFAVAVMVIQNVIGLVLALCLQRFTKGATLLRVLFLIPMLLSSIAIGYIWSYLFQPLFGGLNTLLVNLHMSGLQQDWLGNPHLALGSIIAANCWQWAGYSMIVFLAGLQLIPEDLYEAAEIDGVTDWQRFRHITLPLLAPAVTINFLLTLVGSLRIFDIIYVMTGGGPNRATETIVVKIYNDAFVNNRFGYATAASLVFFLMVLGISVGTLVFLRRREVAL